MYLLNIIMFKRLRSSCVYGDGTHSVPDTSKPLQHPQYTFALPICPRLLGTHAFKSSTQARILLLPQLVDAAGVQVSFGAKVGGLVLEAVTDGELLGSSEGSSDGSSEGSQDGSSDGTSLGSSEGSSDGSSEAASDGMSLGSSEGSSEGSSDGMSLGSSEGSSEGVSLGSLEGIADGKALG